MLQEYSCTLKPKGRFVRPFLSNFNKFPSAVFQSLQYFFADFVTSNKPPCDSEAAKIRHMQ